MLRWRIPVLAAGVLAGASAQAQLTQPVRSNDITVTAKQQSRDRPYEMVDWRMAETAHVVVFSQIEEAALRTTARNLETLHFVLSTLFGRTEAPDPTMKVAVTMIGDAGAFDQLDLTELRWQYGPFPEQFGKSIYYDPRDEGSVIASTRRGINIILQPSRGRATSRNCLIHDGDSPLTNTVVETADAGGLAIGNVGMSVDDFLQQVPVNEIAVCQSAESRLYGVFAQNYLMTYMPAAYPRWFLQGFGEIFATMVVGDRQVEYGQLPAGYATVSRWFGDYPVAQVLNGRYLIDKGRRWTPYDAWRLVHLLYFSDEWKPRLRAYLDAMAHGADPAVAARALGDPEALQRAISGYRGRKVEGERMTFPAERVTDPAIRRLSRAEAGLIRGRLELGARIELPAQTAPDHAEALARQTAWLGRLGDNARRFPDHIENQLLLAEAECRSGKADVCLAAADRALAQAPADNRALVWKGAALSRLATRLPAAGRRQALGEARGYIATANRADPEAILPLIAYYDSFVVAHEAASDLAAGGLYKIVQSSPAAPAARLKLGEELIRRDLRSDARTTLLPVAGGPFDTPERPAAAALLIANRQP